MPGALVVFCLTAALASVVVLRRLPAWRVSLRDYWLDRARRALAAGKPARAARRFVRAGRMSSGSVKAEAYRQAGACRQMQGRLDDARSLLEAAVRAAAESRDEAARARALAGLGLVLQLKGDREEALGYFAQSAAIFGELGDEASQARAQGNQGLLLSSMGEVPQALVCLERARNILSRLSASPELGSVLGNTALVYQQQGALDDALSCLEQALAVARQIGDRVIEANARGNIANIRLQKGQTDHALADYEATLELHRSTGDRAGEARDRIGFGNSLVLKCDYGRAAQSLATALKAFLEIGAADGPRACVGGLRQCLHALGSAELARVCEAAGLGRRTVTTLLVVLDRAGSSPRPSSLWIDHDQRKVRDRPT